ncbi:MAG: hypothetical protein ACRD24_14265 [Terriglobales bacterium]
MLDLITTQTRRCWEALAGSPEYVLAPSPSAGLSPSLSPETITAVEQLTTADGIVTDHALLVLLGQFAQRIGLTAALQKVPIDQKTVTHTPQGKLIQFFIGILAGLPYLQDFENAPAPLSRDTAVGAAWELETLAHSSGISRTLAAASPTTLAALIDVLEQISQPFITREVAALLQLGQPLIIDVDLAGRPISSTSTSYPDASFGWMDDAVQHGYQAAIVTLSGGPTERLMLHSERYTGHTQSADCLQASIRALETRLGLHPPRRTKLVQARLDQLHQELQAAQASAQQNRAQQVALREQLAQLPTTELTERQQRRQVRLRSQMAQKGRVLLTQQHTIGQLERAVDETTQWLHHLEAEAATATPGVQVVVRIDAGFSTDVNLAWLIEMGYAILTKAHSAATTTRLMRQIGVEVVWERVGKNAEAVALGPVRIGDGRYALQAMQVRYQLPERQVATTLLWYSEEAPPAVAGWFRRYNGRQIIEAGIKENKGVFTMQRPLVRSPIGMAIQEQFALFAANFVRWGAAWAREQLANVPVVLARALTEVKTLVRVVAHSRAQLVQSDLGCGLVFDSHSPFAGAVLIIRGQVAYQEPLPLFTNRATTAQKVT